MPCPCSNPADAHLCTHTCTWTNIYIHTHFYTYRYLYTYLLMPAHTHRHMCLHAYKCIRCTYMLFHTIVHVPNSTNQQHTPTLIHQHTRTILIQMAKHTKILCISVEADAYPLVKKTIRTNEKITKTSFFSFAVRCFNLVERD